jgi:hypothetical protein
MISEEYLKYKSLSIICTDLISVLHAFHSLRTQRFELVNEANVALLPKSNEASKAMNYIPISLIIVWQKSS